MVLLHGLGGEFTYIVLASDPTHANETLALVVGLVGFAVVVLINVAATVFSLRHRRRVQRLTGKLVDPFERLLSRWLTSRQRYTRADISPYHRVNGYPPPDPAYQRPAEHDFAGYRLEVCGLVERPLSLALGDLRALAATSQITKHNCIQGWTNIAEWGGVPLAAILDQCRPRRKRATWSSTPTTTRRSPRTRAASGTSTAPSRSSSPAGHRPSSRWI
jgi:DMSO/TMAO reductase YedYZ molybdopterin-dependent catalytic subunit